MNSRQHKIASALALATVGASTAQDPKDQTARATIGLIGGYCCGTLPDVIEPPTNPHHRQFFHSITVGLALGCGLYNLYRWEPETELGDLIKGIGLIAGGAYLVHLALDATTQRSLPLFGRVA